MPNTERAPLIRLDLGVESLLDKFYFLPSGGAQFQRCHGQRCIF
ncbi:hypothetical protein [Rhodoferax fermentans]|nr:hypothetical protein [Rhodoferax fermentans]